MAARNQRLSALSYRLLNVFSTSRHCVRGLHRHVAPSAVPAPTPFVPDVNTFLTLIGRGMNKHAGKINSWDELFTLSSEELRERGLEPAQQRRYLLRWRQKFVRGEYGIGGDLDHVVDGVGEVRVVEIPKATETGTPKESTNEQAHPTATATLNPTTKRAIVNLPPGETEFQYDPPHPLKKYAQIKIHLGNTVKGPYLQAIKGSNGTASRLQVQEGLWEHKLGRKIDGGERRRAEVRAKKRSEERKKA